MIIKKAWRNYPFMDEETWLQMLRDQIDFAYIYEDMNLEDDAGRIRSSYIPVFRRMSAEIDRRYQDLLPTIP